MKDTMRIPLMGPVFEKYKALLRNVYKELQPYEVSDEKLEVTGKPISFKRVAYLLTGEETRKVLQATDARLIADQPGQLEVIFHGGAGWEQQWHGFVEIIRYSAEEKVQKANLPKISRPLFLTEEDELKSARLTPDDPMYSTLADISLKEVEMQVDKKGKLKEVSVPQEGWNNVGKLQEVRLQWLSAVLLECDEAVERMIRLIRVELGLPGGETLSFLTFFDVWGHIAGCTNDRCSKFYADWQVIVHITKYDSWDRLYQSYRKIFHKWGIRK